MPLTEPAGGVVLRWLLSGVRGDNHNGKVASILVNYSTSDGLKIRSHENHWVQTLLIKDVPTKNK